MTLRPIPGAPPGATIPDFPSGNKPSNPEPTPLPEGVNPNAPMYLRQKIEAAASRPFWASRTDQIHVARMAPRRGYSAEALTVRIYRDGTLVIGNEVELLPSAAQRFINTWHSGRGEFDYTASTTVTLHAGWHTYDDGKRGFTVRVHDTNKGIHENFKTGWGALEREAMRCVKELLVMRGSRS
jgi:hypothetical protein